jgi:prolyl 4-hydroxylase
MDTNVVRIVVLVACALFILFVMIRGRTKEHFSVSKVSDPAYNIQEIDDFLTHDECNHIIALASNRLIDSKVYSSKEDVLNTNARISKQAWLKDEDDPVIAAISKKVSIMSGIPIENQEELQIVSYPTGGFFNPHYDPCDGDREECSRMNGPMGPRVWTYLIYLNDGFDGGETVFPKIEKSVIPKKGKCVIFKSTTPDGAILIESFHGGNPVVSGNKWICNKWVRAGKPNRD